MRYFRGAYRDNDDYLAVAKVRQRLSVSKRAAAIHFNTERFNIKKLNDMEIKE
jgi:hypothetical protein